MNKFLLIMGFVLFPIFFANGEVLDYVTYEGYTEIPVTIAWDPAENAQYYKFQLFHYEQKVVAVTGSTSQTQVTINFPRSGHYIFKAQSCDADDQCSDFNESTNPAAATVDNQPRGWWIFKHVSPPGPIETEN